MLTKRFNPVRIQIKLMLFDLKYNPVDLLCCLVMYRSVFSAWAVACRSERVQPLVWAVCGLLFWGGDSRGGCRKQISFLDLGPSFPFHS